MRILQIFPKPPFPQVDGGCMAMAATLRSMLIGKHSVKTICISTHKHPFVEDKIPNDIAVNTKLEAVEIDTRVKPLGALVNLFTARSYNISRFYSKGLESRLKEILEADSFNVILLESIFCTPYLKVIREVSDAKVVVRTHNVEFQIWEQLASAEAIGIKRWYLSLLASRLKKYEVNILKQVDGIVAITEEDKNQFILMGVKCPIEIIPIGFNVGAIKPPRLNPDHLHLYHIGAMDWQPNIEGINWFLDEVWPRIEAEIPETKCFLAGRKMPNYLLDKASGNLKIAGQIDSVADFVSTKNIAIVPLLSGSGMRVKIIEALAMGKVVLTTSIGATGIPYSDGENILIANTPEEFVLKLKYLSDNPKKIVDIGKAARTLAQQEFDITKLSSKLTYFYANL